MGRVKESEELREQQQKHELHSLQEKLYIQEKVLMERTKELEMYRADIRSREDVLKNEFETRSRHEETRLKEMEIRLSNKEQHINDIRISLADKEKELSLALKNIAVEKERYKEESRKKIEETTSDYVTEALDLLEEKQNSLHKIANKWTVGGCASLVLAIISASIISAYGMNIVEVNNNISVAALVFVSIKGLIIITLFIALSKYSFSIGKSYMHESLKNGERRHAINFGKFYLQSYGTDANWNEIKEVFEHWNISNDTAFSNVNADSFDPKTIEKLSSLVQSLSKFPVSTTGNDKSNKEA